MNKLMEKVVWKIACFRMFLHLWKDILYGDVSSYGNMPYGSRWLSAFDCFQIAWLVWME